MINIKKASRDFNEVEKYLMTIAPSIVSVKNLEDNTKIEVDGYITFEDIKEDGETVEILSIITPDKRVYSCQSSTFKRSFNDIVHSMNGKAFSVLKISGTTRNGRDFINCILDVGTL